MQVAQYCPVAVEIQSQAPVTESHDPFPLHTEPSQSKKRKMNKSIHDRAIERREKRGKKKKEKEKGGRRGTKHTSFTTNSIVTSVTQTVTICITASFT
jgi:hypothetical protein